MISYQRYVQIIVFMSQDKMELFYKNIWRTKIYFGKEDLAYALIYNKNIRPVQQVSYSICKMWSCSDLHDNTV